MAKPEAPEFAKLEPSSKALVRRIGNSESHEIVSESGTPGKGWTALENAGWIKIRDGRVEGYTIAFNLHGWECWCRQCDAEEGQPLQPIQFG